MANDKSHQTTLPKKQIGFSSLDVVDRDEPNCKIRSGYELTSAISSCDEGYNDCLRFLSTIPAQSIEEILLLIYGTENSILQQFNLFGHCISADARMSKGFGNFLSQRKLSPRSSGRKAKVRMGQSHNFWDSTGRCFIYNLVAKGRFCDKPDLSTLSRKLQALKIHASTIGISTFAILKLASGLDQMNKQEVVKLIRDIFAMLTCRL